MPDNRDELDRLLDSAMVTYSDPGPDAGLENRILSRIAAEASPKPRRRWLPWVIALPVAAGLVLFAVLSSTRRIHLPPPASQQAGTARLQSAPASGEAGEKRIHRSGDSGQIASGPKGPVECGPVTARLKSCPDTTPHHRRLLLEAKSAPLPKLEMYPTPRPLSPQEEALVNFAGRATESEREALIAAQRRNDAPLSVAAIEIKPLEAPSLGAD